MLLLCRWALDWRCPAKDNGDFGTSPIYGHHSDTVGTWEAERDAQEGLAKDSLHGHGVRRLS